MKNLLNVPVVGQSQRQMYNRHVVLITAENTMCGMSISVFLTMHTLQRLVVQHCMNLDASQNGCWVNYVCGASRKLGFANPAKRDSQTKSRGPGCSHPAPRDLNTKSRGAGFRLVQSAVFLNI